MEFHFDDVTLKPSSTDRVIFADSGITKGELIQFWHEHAELILPELRGRPLTVERYNKGTAGKGFFMKHVQKYYPAWLDRTTVEGKTTFIQPVINCTRDLVYMCNQNALTFHVPTATADSSDNPDRLIFDLDPPPGRFDLVIEAARAVSTLLDELGLSSRLKTTGSKGLHIVVALDRIASYGDVYKLTTRCATLLCARQPDLLTTEFYKKDRRGRLLVDVGRNTYQATAVAAYSVRARPGAPVSLPLSWSEIDDPGLRPDGVGIRELPARLDAVGDLWADFASSSQSLAGAAARLETLENA